MSDVTPGITLDTRFPGDEDIEEPDTSETYPDEAEGGEDPWTPEVIAILRKEGFNVSRLRKAWGAGDQLQ